MENLTQKQIWEKISKPWSEYRQEPVQDVLDFLKLKKGKVLDLGCGSGRHLAKDKDLKFYEVDFSKSMLEYAKKTAEKKRVKAEFAVSDATSLPFENNFFDYAIFIASLHCIDSEQDRKKSVQELFRVLKSEGEALISVWSKQHLRVKGKEKETSVPWTYRNEKLQRYYYLYDKEELENLLKEVGFKIISSKEDYKGIVVNVRKN